MDDDGFERRVKYENENSWGGGEVFLRRAPLMVFLAVVFLLLPMSVHADEWWDSSWDYRKNIKINHSKVNATLTDFPVLVNLSDSDLASKAQDGGEDIVFTNSTGTKLDHEIEHFNGTTGRLVVWVKIPSLSNETDTTIWMYYNNSGAGNQENVTGVWDDNYVGVWHMSEISNTTNRSDSASNNNDGVPTNFDNDEHVTNAQIDGADDFDGSDDYMNVNNDDSLNFGASTDFTVSTWIKTNFQVSGGDYRLYVGKYDGGNAPGWRNIIYYDKAYVFFKNETGDGDGLFSTTVVTDGNWYHVVSVYDRTGNLTLYVDGFKENSTDISTMSGSVSNTDPLIIGSTDLNKYFNGTIDEVRISNISRSAGWIKTSYQNQKNPSTFYGVGSEEIGDSTLPNVTLVLDSPDPQGLGENVTITATVTDNIEVGIVLVGITPPGGSEVNYTMTNQSSIYTYNYLNYTNGTYNYRIYANDTSGNLNDSKAGSFELYSDVYLHVKTLKDSYGANEIVNITDPFEFDLSGLVVNEPDVVVEEDNDNLGVEEEETNDVSSILKMFSSVSGFFGGLYGGVLSITGMSVGGVSGESVRAQEEADLYILKGATGNGDGTSWTDAWDDINYISGIGAGDTVYIAAGTYTGTYTFTANGTSDSNRITIKRATIADHGSDENWNDAWDEDIVFQNSGATFTINNDLHHITIDGQEESGFDPNRTKFLLDGQSGTGYYGVRVYDNAHSITIQNLGITGMNNYGIKFNKPTGDCKILNVEVSKCGNSGTEDVDVLVVYYLGSAEQGWHEIANSYIHDSTFNGGSAATDLIAANSAYMNIHDNTLHAGWGKANSADYISVRRSNMNIYNNAFLGNSDNRNQRIFMSTYFFPISNIKIYNNLFFQNGFDTTVSVSINSRVDSPNIQSNIDVFNNTFYGTNWAIKVDGNARYLVSDYVVKNNIFHASSRELISISAGDASYDFDYNYYYQSAGGMITGSGQTLSDFQSAGWETNGNEGDPLFVDETNPLGPDGIMWTDDDGFRPQSGSPVCGAGENGQDIGAYRCAVSDTAPYRTNPSPNGTLDAGTTQTNISLTTDIQATCRYSNSLGTNYTDMTGTFTNTNSTNHSTEVSGLENGNTYIYYIRCNSTDGYVNDDEFNITFSVAILNVYLLSPSNGYNTAENSVTFNCFANASSTEIDNITLYTNISGWSDEYTNTTGSSINYEINSITDGTYRWNCIACNNESNCSFAASDRTFTVDSTPPVISNIQSSPSTTSAVITWQTDETADSLVRYGTTSGVYTDTESESNYVTSHSITLTSLTNNTTYYLVVNSTDQSGNSAQSVEYNFTTLNETFYIEAESGILTSPMQNDSDVNASESLYIQTTVEDTGTAYYTFNIDTPGTYRILARVYASDGGSDSFYFRVDELEEDTWDLNPGAVPGEFSVWREDNVTKRGTGTYDNPQYDPYTLELLSGAHNITLRGRESYTRLDYFYFVRIGGVTTTLNRTNPSPTDTLSAGTASTNISLTTNVQATCRYSNVSGTNYTDMTGTFTNTDSTNHSTTVGPLSNGETYVYYVRCNSTDGYYNDNDWNITFSVLGHEADTDNDNIITMPELMAFIARWKANATDVSKEEVEDARGIWLSGGGY